MLSLKLTEMLDRYISSTFINLLAMLSTCLQMGQKEVVQDHDLVKMKKKKNYQVFSNIVYKRG